MWKKCKLLGSLLDAEKDINRRNMLTIEREIYRERGRERRGERKGERERRERDKERERYNCIEINRKYDDTCTNMYK